MIIFGIFLVAVLLGVAGFFAWRQKKALEELRVQERLSLEDRLHVRQQARRRLICSFLMVVLAGMMVGWFFLEDQLGVVPADEVEAMAPGPDREARDHALRLLTLYWVAVLLILFIIMVLAAFDFRATARFGLRHRRQLEAEHRALLETYAAQLRHERNGHRQ